MPDTFGKRQRDAAKAKRRETKEVRKAARRANQAETEAGLSEAPEEDRTEDGVDTPAVLEEERSAQEDDRADPAESRS